MPLISTRSFIAPILNKRNLITIVLIAIFFGVFRWAGGGVSTTAPVKKATKTEPAKIERIDPNTLFGESAIGGDDFAPVDPREEVKTITRNSAKARPKDTVAEEDVLKMITPKTKEEPRKKSFEAGESLEDIERSLGLK